ncbi:MAG: efflux RND transporter periplasmic adaptor subunit [Bacteroidota bacterium]
MKEFGIEVGTAGPGELQIRINLPGEIVANADNLVHIVSRVDGIVREVRKRLGDPVRTGEVMAVIESRELADAKAAYLAGLERLALAQTNFTREEKLWKSKISSEQEYLSAKQALAEARIALRSAEQKLHALGFTHEYLKKLPALPDEEFIRYEIVAPFDGTIIKKHITLGEVLSSQSEIYEIADLSSVWVNLTVYQKDLTSVDTGQQVVVRAAQVGTEAAGVIDYVSPIVEESTRTATARVVLENPDGLWRPGIFITGEIDIREVEVGLLVPRSALQTLDGQDVVFVQTPEGFEPQPVKIGLSDSEHVQIVSGLKAGQRFAVTNSFTLKAELGKEAFGGHLH